jgi:quinol monooxygenase YgiN
MPVVATAEYVVTPQLYASVDPGDGTDPDRASGRSGSVQTWAPAAEMLSATTRLPGADQEDRSMLTKVFPIKLKEGKQAAAEALVAEFAPLGPEREPGTLSFRVYRDPAKVDYLLFVEHFESQAAYDAHVTSHAYEELIAGRFSDLIVEFVELDHELLVSL